jgi:hypothetical protein
MPQSFGLWVIEDVLVLVECSQAQVEEGNHGRIVEIASNCVN